MMFGCVILCSAYQLFQAYCSGVHEPDVGINTIYRIYLLQISTRRRLHAGRREDSEVYATSGESTDHGAQLPRSAQILRVHASGAKIIEGPARLIYAPFA